MTRALLLLLILLPGLASLRAEPLSLEQALDLAERQAPGLEAARQGWLSAVDGEAASGAWPDPMLALSVQPRSVETRVGPQRGGLGLQQPLPWPGLRAAQRRAAGERSEQRRQDWEWKRRQVRLEAGLAWLDAWLLEREIESTEALARWYAEREATLKTAWESGGASQGDWSRARMDALRLDLETRTLAARRPARRQRLAAALGLEQALSWTLPAELPPPAAPDSSAFDPTLHPLLLQAEAATREARENATLGRLANRPHLQAGVNWIWTGEAAMPVADSGRDPVVVGLSLNLPIHGRADRSEERALDRLARKAAVAEEARRRDLEQGRETARVELRTALDELRLHERELLPLADDWLGARDEEYRSGSARFPELADAADRRLRLRLQADRLRAAAWSAELRLRLLEDDSRANDVTDED